VAWPRESEWEVQVAALVVPAERLAQREVEPGGDCLLLLALSLSGIETCSFSFVRMDRGSSAAHTSLVTRGRSGHLVI
jgi:hypothetical protein